MSQVTTAYASFGEVREAKRRADEAQRAKAAEVEAQRKRQEQYQNLMGAGRAFGARGPG